MRSPGLSQEFSNSRLDYKVALNGENFKKGNTFKKGQTLIKSVAFKDDSQCPSHGIPPSRSSSEIGGLKVKSLTNAKRAISKTVSPESIDLLSMLAKSPPAEANTQLGFLQQKYGQGLEQNIVYSKGSGLTRQGTMNQSRDFNSMPKESIKEIEYWWQTAEENYQNLVKFERKRSYVDKKSHDDYMTNFMDDNNVFAFKDVLSDFLQKKTYDAHRSQPRSNKFAPHLDRLLTSIALKFRKVPVIQLQKADNEKMRSRKSPYSTEYLLKKALLAAKRHDELKKEISGEQESDLAQQ